MTTSQVEPSTAQGGLSPAARQLLERRLRGRAGAAPAGIPRISPRPDRVPLSSAQQGLYFLHRLDPRGTEYLMPAAWRFTGPLDLPALDAAVGDLADRHEQLRVVFPDVDGVPAQEVLPTGGTGLHLVELPEGADAAAVADAVRTAALRPFDLAVEPGFRATLLRVAAEDHVLVLALHHIVADGWSLDLLLRDLRAFHEARSTGGAPPADPAPIAYADYAIWQRGRDEGADLAYWRSALAGLTPLELPLDHPRPATRSYAGAVHTVRLPEELTAALAQAGRRTDTTPYMTTMAAFQAALGFHSGQDDIAIGTVVANRERPETEQLVGFFVNTLVVRTDLAGDPTGDELLARTRESVLGALSHQTLPFERVVDELSPDRDLSRNPLFQVLFTHTAAERGHYALGGATGAAFPVDLVTAKFDLTLDVLDDAGALSLRFVYRPDLFAAQSMARLAEHTVAVLRAFTRTPSVPLSRTQLLTEPELAELLGPEGPANRPVAAAGDASATRAPRLAWERLAEHIARTPAPWPSPEAAAP